MDSRVCLEAAVAVELAVMLLRLLMYDVIKIGVNGGGEAIVSVPHTFWRVLPFTATLPNEILLRASAICTTCPRAAHAFVSTAFHLSCFSAFFFSLWVGGRGG